MARTSSFSQTLSGASARSSKFGNAQQLVGELESNGLATLHIDASVLIPDKDPEPRPMEAALDGAAAKKGSESDTASTASDEDYDRLEISPETVISGGKGGGFGQQAGQDSATVSSEKVYEEIRVASKTGKSSRPAGPLRLKSIPITLQRSGEKGKYWLVADNAELKDILKMTAERNEQIVKTKRRTKFSDIMFTRQFTAFDRQNTESSQSPFHGFFNLVWLGIAIFIAQTSAANYVKFGNIMGTNEIMSTMMHRDLIVLGLSDGVLYLSTGFGWVLQCAIARGWISWNKQGWIIQNIWQIFYISFVVYWTLFREWPWTHCVFFVLHGLIMLMKQHSYAFYNGHLSVAFRSRKALESRLRQLEDTEPAQTPSASTPAVSSLTTSYLDQKPNSSEMTQRRQLNRTHSVLQDPLTGIAQISEAIKTGEALDLEQIQLFEKIIRWEIDALGEELKGKATHTDAQYPNNLTLKNHYEWVLLPTLTYELEYPRSEKINWAYVAEKGIATAGILFIMMLVSQSFIYPVVMRCIAMKDAEMPLLQRLYHFPGILSELIFPFMLEYLMAWYIIWECILNLLAELTCFADRGFYADWWNSTSWDQFARDWNRPVHNFLLRHVYHSSISSMRVNKVTATLITFAISAVVHELVMWCIFKKLRGYLLVFQMLQLPLVQLSRSRFLKGRATLGNLFFWVGIFTGPSLLCSLYLII